MEGFIGLGFLTGPIFGSIMFMLGGYIMPFLASGIIFILFFPLVICNLNYAK